MSRVILVLGMHRSGTSVIAKSLECLGVSLGDNAGWTGPDNPTGFQEDRDALAINEYAMSLFRGWDSPEPLPVSAGTKLLEQAYPAAVNLLRQRTERFPLWGLKEPRLCRLLPMWRPALQAVGCQVGAVHVVRHPTAVAASLLKRNSMPIEKGLRLWLEYTRRARLDVDPRWPAVTVRYEAMMANPIAQIGRIGLALGLRVNMAAARRFEDQFISMDLWHEAATDMVLPAEVADEWDMAFEESRR